MYGICIDRTKDKRRAQSLSNDDQLIHNRCEAETPFTERSTGPAIKNIPIPCYSDTTYGGGDVSEKDNNPEAFLSEYDWLLEDVGSKYITNNNHSCQSDKFYQDSDMSFSDTNEYISPFRGG